MNSTTDYFRWHVEVLTEQALSGSSPAIRSLCAMALLAEGWRPGDPEPEEELEAA